MKKALVVGIDNYPRSPLSCCVNDAKLVAELLENNQDGSKNFDLKIETSVFTKAVLRTMIVELFSGSCDTALLYFSGHGYVNAIGGYICTPDGKLYDEGILMDEILKLANASKATNKIIILDCCYAGRMGAPVIWGPEASFLHDGVTIFTASRHDETAGAGKKHSVFTELLIEALKGGAANLSGQITPGSIYAFVDQALGPFDQRPTFKTNTTRFYSLRNVNPQVSPEIVKKLVKYFPTSLSEVTLDPSFEDTNHPSVKPLLEEPYAIAENIAVFKHLQKLQSIGLVVPVDEPFMYFAAMRRKSCKLTPLGQHYWRLVKEKRI